MTPHAAQQIEQLNTQHLQLRARRSDLLAQLEQTDKAIEAVTNALQGVQLGRQLAESEAQLHDPDSAPQPK